MSASGVTLARAAGRTGLARSELRLALTRPGFRQLVYANVLLAAAGAMAPTGIHGLSPGVGAIGGAAYGVRAAVLLFPAVAAVAAALAITDLFDRRMIDIFVLSGTSRLRIVAARACSTGAAALVALAAAPPVGAVVGLGDSLRQQGDYLGHWRSLPDLGMIALVASFLIVAFSAVAATLRTAHAAFGAIAGSVIGFLLLVQLSHGRGLPRLLAAASPWGPLWSQVHHQRDEFYLGMTSRGAMLGSLAWCLVAGALLLVSTRPGRNR